MLDILFLFIFTQQSLPHATLGRVVAVADGDTLTILRGNQQTKIRLDGIDAPEKNQPHGQAAKQALSELTFGRYVVVLWKKRDRYGRTLGHVLTPTWANYQLATDGHAWHFKRYNKSPRLSDAELAARNAKRGLWAGESVPPWEWRKRPQASLP